MTVSISSHSDVQFTLPTCLQLFVLSLACANLYQAGLHSHRQEHPILSLAHVHVILCMQCWCCSDFLPFLPKTETQTGCWNRVAEAVTVMQADKIDDLCVYLMLAWSQVLKYRNCLGAVFRSGPGACCGMSQSDYGQARSILTGPS